MLDGLSAGLLGVVVVVGVGVRARAELECPLLLARTWLLERTAVPPA